MAKRARHMASIAVESLKDIVIGGDPTLERRIVRAPKGVVLAMPAWNYPLLTAVNVVVPAVLAGNAVVLKHSPRSPSVGERFAKAFRDAGAPKELVQALQCDHAASERMVGDVRVDHVAFTGSTYGGHRIQAAAKDRLIELGLELGGNDAAYVGGRRRPGQGGRGHRRRCLLQRGPVVLRGRARLRAPLALRRVHRRLPAAHAGLRDGRSAQPGDQPRSHRAAVAPRRARGASARRRAPRREAPLRRQEAEHRRQGPLLRAHAAHRRPRRRRGDEQGVVRPAAAHRRRRRRRARAPFDERRRARPDGERVDHRSRARQPHGAAASRSAPST